MKKIVRLTESDLKRIISEVLKSHDKHKGNEDIIKTFKNKEHYKWFDYLNPNVDIPRNSLEVIMKDGLDMLTKMFKYKLDRVVIKDKGEIVAFLIYTKEGKIIDDIGDGNKYPVLLSVAVKPEYRNKGLLKMMIEKSGVKKPYLVQTGVITTPEVWEKLGCKVVKKIDTYNSIQKCD
jgi:N-acetylglutamate synthase-like GNAT family acetyltransferase